MESSLSAEICIGLIIMSITVGPFVIMDAIETYNHEKKIEKIRNKDKKSS